MVNIQIHGVISAKWAEHKGPEYPRVFLIETLTGEQAISLFPARQSKPVEKKGEPEDQPEPPRNMSA